MKSAKLAFTHRNVRVVVNVHKKVIGLGKHINFKIHFLDISGGYLISPVATWSGTIFILVEIETRFWCPRVLNKKKIECIVYFDYSNKPRIKVDARDALKTIFPFPSISSYRFECYFNVG